MGRAVVTGASGFLGGALSRALRLRGDDVVGLDTVRAPGVTVADTSRPGDWERELEDADLVVHAAALPIDGADPAEARRVDLEGTTVVLDAALRAGVGRVVVLGSADLHADLHADEVRWPVDEDTPADPGDSPDRALAAAVEERALAAASRGLPVTVVRAAEVYGPRSRPWTLRPVSLLRTGRFVLVDGGRGLLAPLHVDDFVAGVLALVDSPAAAGEVVHLTAAAPVAAGEFFGHYVRMVGGRPPRSVPLRVARALAGPPPRPVAAVLSAALGHPLPRALVHRAPVRVPTLTTRAVEAVTRRQTFSIAKAARLVGWHPLVSLEEGMGRTELWLRERGLLGVPEPSRRG